MTESTGKTAEKIVWENKEEKRAVITELVASANKFSAAAVAMPKAASERDRIVEDAVKAFIEGLWQSVEHFVKEYGVS